MVIKKTRDKYWQEHGHGAKGNPCTLLKCEKDKGCNKDSVLQYQIRVNGSLIIREGLWIPTK